ncbi:DUF305 domain-containing protein [Streptomyces millisiae]|uniref:DUF305 domain-containing protein n=1 Tax=Streptomyces millisiae TaxID=3075542 RepID=A0ABU2LUU6_9ACTN|nr:DUF305 domain-containing protein [Streptomyces sp. DSM 44918]MDT0321331.1 DUF305 domain-containing protein [Streptomyces sp. DSM 44918]
MTDRRRPLLAALAAVAALTLAAGCTDEAEPAADADSQQVIAPAGPGEPARTISPEEAREAAQEGTEPNAADFRFMRMMIEHHEQALTMAELVDDRSDEESVRRLADRITAGQNGEIAAMEAWLTRNAGAAADEDREGHGGHDSEDMPGMATPEQLEALEAAEGAEFDALFLDLMIAHHQGAVTMTTEALTTGNDGPAQQLANDMLADQSVEIDRMEAMR